MKLLQKLAHAVWDCKYHIVWCPQYRFRILKGEVAKSVIEIIQQLCEWKRLEVLEKNVQLTSTLVSLSFSRKTFIGQIDDLSLYGTQTRVNKKMRG